MAIRLQSEFKSDQGDQFKIEIHDSEWLGGIYEFVVDSRGFDLNYSGETDDIVSPLVSSNLTFGAYSNDAYFEAFIDDLKQHQENRFRVVVYRSDAHTGRTIENGLVFEPLLWEEADTSYQLWWVGWIMQDLVNVEDASQPYIYEISAVDGFGRLANIDYSEANDIDQTGLVLTKIVDVIHNALVLIGVDDLFPATNVFLETSVDWWETNYQTYSTSVDPLTQHAFDVRLFENTDDDGNIVYSSALDILKNIATLYNARVYMNHGKFIFEQYGNRAQTTRYASRYNKAGASIGRVLINDDVTLDQTLYGARLAGNAWDFLPALENISIKYVQRFLNPWNAFAVYPFNGIHSSSTNYTVGFIAGGSGIKIAYSTNALNFSINASQTPYPLIPIFKWRIRIKDSSTGIFYYCNRAYNGITSSTAMYGAPTWSTTAGYYYFDLPAFFHLSTTSTISPPVQLITPDLPVSGELYVEMSFHSVVRANDGTAHSFTGIQYGSQWVFAIDNSASQGSPGITYTARNNNAEIDSNLSLDLGEIYIADGPKQTGHLSIYNGSTWQGSSAWRKGSSGSSLPILKLLTLESMALHATPIYQYNGNIVHGHAFQQRLIFDSGAYLMTSGTYSANLNEWSGTWYKIQSIRTNITTIDPIDDKVDRLPLSVGGGSSGGSSPNDIIGGRIGGMLIVEDTKSVGPFQQVTGGGKVNGTLQATGAATMSSTLSVMGNSTFAADADFEGSHTALVQDVEHSDGSEYDVRDTDFIVFNSWVGGNGEAFINLPEVSASEGRMIRFKSDDTIGANTYVTLRPNGTDTSATIDGETSATFNRSYDGIMVLCHSSQWYIVQRKSK